jgi:predicted nucleotidyltransferase
MGTFSETSGEPLSGGAIGDALFTNVQQRVLGLLFGNADRSFYANELIHLAGSGSGAVQRELAKLTSAGLVTLRRVGNQTHYQANPASPVYEELRTLILKTSGLVDVLRSALAPRAAEISLAFVFGSVAKRIDSAKSDIDVLIVSDTLSYAELFTLLETASQRLGRPVNPTMYSRQDITARITKKNAFIGKVFAQPKLWIIGSERDIAP